VDDTPSPPPKKKKKEKKRRKMKERKIIPPYSVGNGEPALCPFNDMKLGLY
jgi:hypothetical protein